MRAGELDSTVTEHEPSPMSTWAGEVVGSTLGDGCAGSTGVGTLLGGAAIAAAGIGRFGGDGSFLIVLRT